MTFTLTSIPISNCALISCKKLTMFFLLRASFTICSSFNLEETIIQIGIGQGTSYKNGSIIYNYFIYNQTSIYIAILGI